MTENVLVLGFYNRNNIGDEAYKLVLPMILKNKNVIFECMDDIEYLPENIDIVVCGGGDIINEYFMEKAQKLLKDFKGRVYGISVGIPYLNGVKFLHIFDHVFVRSTQDYKIAVKEIGSLNVTYIPDAVCLLSHRNKTSSINTFKNKINIGLCLAEPLFNNNNNRIQLIDSIVNSLILLGKYNKNIIIYLLAFNHHQDSKNECDYELNYDIYNKLTKSKINCVIRHDIKTPENMLDFFNRHIDIPLCMRYHSVIFSIMTNKRFVPLYCSKKVDNLLEDLNYKDERFVYKLNTNSQFKPLSIDNSKLFTLLKNAVNNRNITYDISRVNNYFNIENELTKLKDIIVSNKLESFNDVLIACKNNISKYLQIEPYVYEELLYHIGPIKNLNIKHLNLARFICYIITGQTNHPTVWGLCSNFRRQQFCLYDAIKYIWDDCKNVYEECETKQNYYPKILNLKREVFLNLDFVFQNDFSKFHRSGWSYAVGGIMNLDAPRLLRASNILLDIYVDRSFHWGNDILKTLDIVPYKQPWYGFVHHTFDTTHSEYNCVNMFKNDNFILSLKTCKGLFALTNYLANQLKNKLNEIDINVPVFTLCHPMEFVENNFTIEKFINNTNKSVVQIGAWLRKPYSIYELPIHQNNNFTITKKALKGREMEQYFSPPNFFNKLEDFLLNTEWSYDNSEDIDQDDCNIICSHTICRGSSNSGNANKFCSGIYDMLFNQINEVEVLTTLNNEDYDKLLSENIIFLNLVDASAVNTVIECIVRNTPIIINRLESLEELLGKNYPGFYDNLVHASSLCTNIEKITEIHRYLTRLNKDKYKLETFINDIQTIIKYNIQPNTLDESKLFINQQNNSNITSSMSLLLKYPNLAKLFPKFNQILF